MTNLCVKNEFCEGQSTSWLPYFDEQSIGIGKPEWKFICNRFIMLNVSKDPYIPIKIVNNIEELKMEDEFDEHDMKKIFF